LGRSRHARRPDGRPRRRGRRRHRRPRPLRTPFHPSAGAGDGPRMTARRIIPCLDVKDGRVVKGVRFEGHVDMGDAADLAARYRDHGADELVFYDITASPEGRTLDYGWVKNIARLLDIPFSVAGGIRSVEQAARCLDHGADKVSINSPALERPELIGEM